MSMQRTPPGQASQALLKPNIVTESDTASDYVASDPDSQLNITRRYKRKHSDSTLCEIRDMLADLQQQQKTQTAKFNEEMNKMSQQNNDIMQSIQHMSDKYDDILCQLKQTKLENAVLKNQMKSLEQKMEVLERNSKACSLEMRNVPVILPENKSILTGMVKNLGDVLNVEVMDTDIRNIYRIKNPKNKSAPIIVEFSSTVLKENVIKASKTFNRDNKDKINTSHLKLQGEKKPVFISESLTASGRRLFFLAREYVKKHKYASCWASYGKVYIREKESAPAKLISCDEDFGSINTQ